MGVLILIQIFGMQIEAKQDYLNMQLPSSVTKNTVDDMSRVNFEDTEYSSYPKLRIAGDPNDPNYRDDPELGLPFKNEIESILLFSIGYIIYHIIINKKRFLKKEK